MAEAAPVHSWHSGEHVWAAASVVTSVLVGLTIGLLPHGTALTVAVAAAVAWAMWQRPPLGVAAVVLSVPLQDSIPAHLGGAELTWTRLLTGVVMIVWVAQLAAGRLRVRINAISVGFALAMAPLLFSAVAARDLSLWTEEVYRWAIASVFFLVASSALRTERDAIPILWALGTGIGVSLAVAVYQVLTNQGPASFEVRGLLRAYGLFGEPNPFAGYLEFATLPLLAIVVARLAGRRTECQPPIVFVLAGSAAGLVALVLSQSRGGLLGLLAGCAVLVWTMWPIKGPRLVTVAVLAALVLSVLPAAAPMRSALNVNVLLDSDPEQVSTANFAAQERLAHWRAAWAMWQDQPWTGIGAGNFSERYREYTEVWRFRIPRGHAHSAYLQAGAQAGTAGAVGYIALLGAVGYAVHRRRTESGRLTTLSAVGLAVTAALAVHGVFEYLHVLSLGLVLSAVWAVALVEECDSVVKTVPNGQR